MTFNIEDVRSGDLVHGNNPRLKQVAEIIQRLRPTVLVLNEIALDPDRRNAQRFVERYLSVAQAPELEPISFSTYMPMSNTGVASGFDLDNSGRAVTEFPEPRASDTDGAAPAQTPEGRAFGNDSHGFGTFPGQYSMALLVHPSVEIVTDRVRTYQRLLWSELPGATKPTNLDGSDWYSADAWDSLRLSSKNHALVPIRFPNGTEIEIVMAHPTPPAFDGEERRNKLRNRDEIRLLSMILSNDPRIVDDKGDEGGVDPGTAFLVMGDLNADPQRGSSIGSPISEFLFNHKRMGPDPGPRSMIQIDRLDSSDTARFGLRVDYVLASKEIRVTKSEVWRLSPSDTDGFPSDHFPVWAELVVPAASERE